MSPFKGPKNIARVIVLAGALTVETDKNGKRNRAIFLAFIGGQTVAELAEQYQLSLDTIRGILNAQRHRISVSSDPEYCELRQKVEPANWVRAYKRTLDS